MVMRDMEEIAAFAVPTKPLLKKGVAFLCFVLYVLSFVLEKLLFSVSKLAFCIVPTVPILQKVNAQLILELGVGGQRLLRFIFTLAGGLSHEGSIVGRKTRRYHQYGN